MIQKLMVSTMLILKFLSMQMKTESEISSIKFSETFDQSTVKKLVYKFKKEGKKLIAKFSPE